MIYYINSINMRPISTNRKKLVSLNFSQENFTNRRNLKSGIHQKEKDNDQMDNTQTINRNNFDLKKFFDENARKKNFNNLVQILKTDIIEINELISKNRNLLFIHNLKDCNNEKTKFDLDLIYNNSSYLKRIQKISDEIENHNIKDEMDEISNTSDIDSILKKMDFSESKKDELFINLFIEKSLNDLFFRKLSDLMFIEDLKNVNNFNDTELRVNSLSRFYGISKLITIIENLSNKEKPFEIENTSNIEHTDSKFIISSKLNQSRISKLNNILNASPEQNKRFNIDSNKLKKTLKSVEKEIKIVNNNNNYNNNHLLLTQNIDFPIKENVLSSIQKKNSNNNSNNINIEEKSNNNLQSNNKQDKKYTQIDKGDNINIIEESNEFENSILTQKKLIDLIELPKKSGSKLNDLLKGIETFEQFYNIEKHFEEKQINSFKKADTLDSNFSIELSCLNGMNVKKPSNFEEIDLESINSIKKMFDKLIFDIEKNISSIIYDLEEKITTKNIKKYKIKVIDDLTDIIYNKIQHINEKYIKEVEKNKRLNDEINLLNSKFIDLEKKLNLHQLIKQNDEKPLLAKLKIICSEHKNIVTNQSNSLIDKLNTLISFSSSEKENLNLKISELTNEIEDLKEKNKILKSELQIYDSNKCNNSIKANYGNGKNSDDYESLMKDQFDRMKKVLTEKIEEKESINKNQYQIYKKKMDQLQEENSRLNIIKVCYFDQLNSYNSLLIKLENIYN